MMKIKDLKEEEIVVGLRIRSLSRDRCGTVTEIDKDHDNLAWTQWDGEVRPTSGFYGNDCECEVVLDRFGRPEILVNALEFELEAVRHRYNNAFDRLRGYALGKEDWNKGLKEVVVRLLTSRVLASAIGGYEQTKGYMSWLNGNSDTPLNRMEFIVHFVGHELLDDGDPGIGWHRWTRDGRLMMEDCLETDNKAEPYFNTCHELLPPGSKHLYVKDVIWILDWHEKKEEEFYKAINSLHDILDHPNKKEERPSENRMLVVLAEKICGKNLED